MVAGAITGGLVGQSKVISNSTYKTLLLMGAQGLQGHALSAHHGSLARYR